jgi:predicted ester cyclase
MLSFATVSSAQGETRVEKVALVIPLYQAFDTGNVGILDEVVAEAFVDHMVLPGPGPGLGGLKEAVTIFRTGLPDMNITIGAVVVEDDLVAVRQVTTGTHRGDFLGMPATGAEVSFAAFDMYRVQDGLIVESWHVEDLLSMLTQIGASTE